ncbi:MAG: hypothetical protein ACJA0I_001733 [Gammaproteobacteria bacterium]
MNTLRCLIADIPQKLLADIVHRVAHLDGAIEVVGQVPQLSEIPRVLSQQEIDVIIVGMGDDFECTECWEILHKYPDLLVIGLVNDGRMVVVCFADLSSIQLINLISGLGKLSQRKISLDEQYYAKQPIDKQTQ